MKRFRTLNPESGCTILFLLFLLALPPSTSAQQQEPATTAAATKIEFTVQTGHLAEIQGLEYASDGKFFVTAGKDSTLKLWSPTGTLIRTIRAGFWVNYLALSHDNQLLFAAARTGTIFLLSLDGRVVHRFPDIPMKEGFISCVALSDDNRYFAVGTTRGLVLYRLDGTTETRLESGQDTSEVQTVLYARDGRLISGYFDGKVRFWSAEGKLLRTITALEYSVKTLALSPDGKTLATAGSAVFFRKFRRA